MKKKVDILDYTHLVGEEMYKNLYKITKNVKNKSAVRKKVIIMLFIKMLDCEKINHNVLINLADDCEKTLFIDLNKKPEYIG